MSKIITLLLVLSIAFSILANSEEKEIRPWYHVFFIKGFTYGYMFNDMSEVNKIAKPFGSDKIINASVFMTVDAEIQLKNDYSIFFQYVNGDGIGNGPFDRKYENGEKTTRDVRFSYGQTGIGFGRYYDIAKKSKIVPVLMVGQSYQSLKFRIQDNDFDWNTLGINIPVSYHTVELFRDDIYIQPRIDLINKIGKDLGLSLALGYNIGFETRKWRTFKGSSVKNAPKSVMDGITVSLGFKLL